MGKKIRAQEQSRIIQENVRPYGKTTVQNRMGSIVSVTLKMVTKMGLGFLSRERERERERRNEILCVHGWGECVCVCHVKETHVPRNQPNHVRERY